mmetsp:Transcript_12910/g.47811  ORF Transcript_12910/g.47811 Transcript_12910/m.47811 type:complete len:267 (+) Transcript_12910:1074-1874(+)
MLTGQEAFAAEGLLEVVRELVTQKLCTATATMTIEDGPEADKPLRIAEIALGPSKPLPPPGVYTQALQLHKSILVLYARPDERSTSAEPLPIVAVRPRVLCSILQGFVHAAALHLHVEHPLVFGVHHVAAVVLAVLAVFAVFAVFAPQPLRLCLHEAPPRGRNVLAGRLDRFRTRLRQGRQVGQASARTWGRHRCCAGVEALGSVELRLRHLPTSSRGQGIGGPRGRPVGLLARELCFGVLSELQAQLRSETFVAQAEGGELCRIG